MKWIPVNIRKILIYIEKYGFKKTIKKYGNYDTLEALEYVRGIIFIENFE